MAKKSRRVLDIESTEGAPPKKYQRWLRYLATTGRQVGSGSAEYLDALDRDHAESLSAALAGHAQSLYAAPVHVWAQQTADGWHTATVTGADASTLLAVAAPSLAHMPGASLGLVEREGVIFVATLDGMVSVIVGTVAPAWRDDGPANVLFATVEDAERSKLTPDQRAERDELLFMCVVRANPGIRGVSAVAPLAGIDQISASAALKRLMARDLIENRGAGPSRPRLYVRLQRVKIRRWRRPGGEWVGTCVH